MRFCSALSMQVNLNTFQQDWQLVSRRRVPSTPTDRDGARSPLEYLNTNRLWAPARVAEHPQARAHVPKTLDNRLWGMIRTLEKLTRPMQTGQRVNSKPKFKFN
jgi:hypothetical protein